jgi:hypothetical protein
MPLVDSYDVAISGIRKRLIVDSIGTGERFTRDQENICKSVS